MKFPLRAFWFRCNKSYSVGPCLMLHLTPRLAFGVMATSRYSTVWWSGYRPVYFRIGELHPGKTGYWLHWSWEICGIAIGIGVKQT